MIVDYWLDEAGDYVGGDGAFLPYRMLGAYAAEPPRGAELTGQEAAMAGLFELRLMLDFESYRVLCAPPETTTLGHHVLESSMGHMAMETLKFDGLYWAFYSRLGGSRKGAVSHLLTVAQEASRMAARARAMADRGRADGDGAGNAGPLDERGMSPESEMLACAGLVNTAIDGTMHAMPDEFLGALGKAAQGGHVAGIGDPEAFFRGIPERVGERPIRCMRIERAGEAALPLLARLARIRWGIYADIGSQRNMHKMQEGYRGVSKIGMEILAQRMSWNLRHMALDLESFLDTYRGISAAAGGGAADGVVADVLANEAAIRRLCGIVRRGGAGGREPFAAAILEGIGYGKFLLLAAGASEWAGVNMGHYRARCPDGGPLPDLPWRVRRVDHEAVDRAVALARARARGAMARACPAAA